ncbi:MAG: hypothetical protein PHI97_16710 [Desulfobulbus sp.]|nr:hypothetical protein [Desulfobulbus sp.]
MHSFSRYSLALGLIVILAHPLSAAVLPKATVPQAQYPEDEIVLRREMINHRVQEAERKARARGASSRLMAIPHALPLRGMLQIKSGSTSTFYGKLRRDLKYTIKERFVGNLIVTRYYDNKAGRYTDREEYSIDTLSLEIDASDFKGKICSKYAGAPPTCTQWQELDLWQVGEGEEYPGKNSSVISATSSGQTVSLKLDGPDILFVPSDGGQGLKSSCGDLVQQRFSRDEFKRMLKKKLIKVNKVLGKTFPGCRPGSTVTLDMEIGK